jgi:2',3'-cyclic-nucleotide 2'-phosphodiesterase (5'-nucleotidase family)
MDGRDKKTMARLVKLARAVVKDVHGVKVGLFGLSYKGPLADPSPATILPYLPIAQPTVDALRAAGAQVVVCLTHFGMARARSLAGAVSGIDVIVNGHDNAVLEQPEAVAQPGGGTTLIVSAGGYYRYVGRLRLLVNGATVSFVDYALLGADADTPSLPAVQQAIEALKPGIVARYGDVYHQTLAWADQDIVNESDPGKAKRDTPLGNLLTDAYRARTGTDIALEASGYIGESLPEGPIVGADVFRSMSLSSLVVPSSPPMIRPWRLVTLNASGAALIGALETTIKFGGDYFPQVSGVRFDYDSRLPAGQRIQLNSVHVGGTKLELGELYSLTVTEGVLLALQKLGMPVQDVVTQPDLAFDAVRALVAERGEIGPAASNRLRDIAAIPGSGRLQTAATLVGPAVAAPTRAPIAEDTNPSEVRREPTVKPVKPAVATAGTVQGEAVSRPRGTEVRREQ